MTSVTSSRTCTSPPLRFRTAQAQQTILQTPTVDVNRQTCLLAGQLHIHRAVSACHAAQQTGQHGPSGGGGDTSSALSRSLRVCAAEMQMRARAVCRGVAGKPTTTRATPLSQHSRDSAAIFPGLKIMSGCKAEQALSATISFQGQVLSAPRTCSPDSERTSIKPTPILHRASTGPTTAPIASPAHIDTGCYGTQSFLCGTYAAVAGLHSALCSNAALLRHHMGVWGRAP